MSGFGHGPFGLQKFGEWYWSEYTLYRRLPQLDRDADDSADLVPAQPLKKMLLAVGNSMDRERRKMRDWTDLRNPTQVRTQYTEITTHLLGKIIKPKVDAEQYGVNGEVNSFLEFYDPTARFFSSFIGHVIKIYDSSIPGNNREVRITSIVNINTVRTDFLLAVDAGPFRWDVRPFQEEGDEIVTLEIRSGSTTTIYPGWILRDGASEFSVLARRNFGHALFDTTQFVERQGRDASIDGLGRLSAPSGAFTVEDIGHPVVLGSTSELTNTGRFEIISIVSPTIAELSVALTPESGPFYWSLLPYPHLDLDGTAIPRGVVEQDGLDAEADAPDLINLPTTTVTDAEIGKTIRLLGSSLGNDGVHEIIAVPSPNQVQVSSTLVLESPLRWELRTKTVSDNLIDVTVRAPSLIKTLSYDFGLETDVEESEARQRMWVQRVTNWIDKKGVREAYQMIGAITGYDVDVEQLFRVTQDISSGFPAGTVLEVGESAEGRSGTNGSLSAGSGGRVRFSDPDALFASTDVGRSIRISGTPSTANDKLYEIELVIDDQTVDFRVVDTATLPDARTLTWRIVRLYVTEPPAVPLYDDINVDALILATAGAFTIDTYCWEPGFSTDVAVTITAATASGYLTFDVTGTGDFDVVADVGHWLIIDSNEVEFFLETVPTGGGPWTFTVKATQAPALGAATLTYRCPVILTCDYCASNKILITIAEGTIVSDPALSQQKADDRVYRRLLDEPRPIHVELVPRFEGSHLAALTIGAVLEP